jgi:predicted nucleotidyltransferase
MKSLNDILETLSSNKDHLASEYGLSSIAVFGSYSTGKQTGNSDIDILVEFKKPVGVEFIDLANELEQILENPVDLVSKKGIKPGYFEKIRSELRYV